LNISVGEIEQPRRYRLNSRVAVSLERASTIFCSQFPVDAWHDKIGEPAVADAICDRIVHDSYNIVLHGDGMRKRKGLKEA
jgi:DNA replication protein DnaC